VGRPCGPRDPLSSGDSRGNTGEPHGATRTGWRVRRRSSGTLGAWVARAAYPRGLRSAVHCTSADVAGLTNRLLGSVRGPSLHATR